MDLVVLLHDKNQPSIHREVALFMNWMAKGFQGVFIKNLSIQSVSRPCYEKNDYCHQEYLKVAQIVNVGFTKMPKEAEPSLLHL